jgi:long-chain-fatty-acid---luciferin-component ligase
MKVLFSLHNSISVFTYERKDLEASMEIKGQIEKLNERLARYIPPRETWTPAEEALFNPSDILRVPVDQARATQLKSIKYAFSRHYNLNDFYHKYCEEEGVTPDDIKTYDDLEKIPLIPDLTFKQHPSGKGLGYWLTVIFTGDLPKVVIKGANPSFDDVVNAFNAAGIIVTHSSGTSGRISVLPRDMRTLLNYQYSIAKMTVCLSDDLSIEHTLSLLPKGTQSGLFIGRATAYIPDLYNDVRNPLDLQISADMTHKTMTAEEQEHAPPSAGERLQKMVENTIKWLERYEKTADTIRLAAPPFLIFVILDELERQGRRFEFGERGMVMTGGGWKKSEDARTSRASFSKRVEETLGIPETRCTDLYGMTEMNTMAYTCPDGHYFHLPYTWLTPMVLDESLTPADYGEWGRFAFLDGLPGSYPGFVITGDEVRMHERCPVCDRPGPVLESEIKRAKGEEVRGCAEVIRRVLAEEGKTSLR